MRQETLNRIEQFCNIAAAIGEDIKTDTYDVLASNDLTEIIRHYDQVRKAADRLKKARETIEMVTDRLSKEHVPDAMRSKGVKTISVDGVGRVTVSYRYSCSIIDSDDPRGPKYKGYDWLRSNGAGELITETVNSQTLSAFAKDMLEDKGVELPSDIFRTSTSPYTSITKVK